MNLFEAEESEKRNLTSDSFEPLAARVRPQNISEYIGQKHLVGEGAPLHQAIKKQALHSMVLWGPPGVGKTTFANLIAQHFSANFIQISAVLSGVKEIRESIDSARLIRKQYSKPTILFVDEVHRFNKSQQDAFLPFVEDGTVVFIGATTENPSFELNNALLSRARVYILKKLSNEDMIQLLKGALSHPSGFPSKEISISDELLQFIVKSADGDARKALNFLELAVDLAKSNENTVTVHKDDVANVLQSSLKRFDKGGDIFYEQISALHKSVRGSDPDAALYWFVRMIEGGCDPLYVARRVVRMASEDIGNADPRALTMCLSAWDVQERLGSPEGELAIAQAIIYLSISAKSNAVYKAFNDCRSFVSSMPDDEVPMHLRNAPTKLMKQQGMGEGYRYAHDEPEGFAAGENYFPESIKDQKFYFPVDRGLELKINAKLQHLRDLNQKAKMKRYG